MTLSTLLKQLNSQPETVEFDDVIAVINKNYNYTATEFTNGETVNLAGTNEGSCKIFAFAQQQNLTESQTLACFGKYYRQDVLSNPKGSDHANIRNFMNTGWAGVNFVSAALTAK